MKGEKGDEWLLPLWQDASEGITVFLFRFLLSRRVSTPLYCFEGSGRDAAVFGSSVCVCHRHRPELPALIQQPPKLQLIINPK